MIMPIQRIVIHQQPKLFLFYFFTFVGILIIWNHFRDIKWNVNIIIIIFLRHAQNFYEGTN